MRAQQPADTPTAGVFGMVRDSVGRGLAGTSVRAIVLAGDPTIGPTTPLMERETTADDQGHYNVDGLPSGALILQFRRIGYVPLADTLVLVAGMRWERNVTLHIVLHALDTVRVEAAEDKYHRRLTDVVSRFAAHQADFITRRQIDSVNPSTTTDMFRRRAGVIVRPGQSGSGKIKIPQPDFSDVLPPPCPGIR